MPFRSKKQWRAAFGGHIPGISKKEAKEWADKTEGGYKGLPAAKFERTHEVHLDEMSPKQADAIQSAESRTQTRSVDTGAPAFMTPSEKKWHAKLAVVEGPMRSRIMAKRKAVKKALSNRSGKVRGRGELSESLRDTFGRVGSDKRDKMPPHVFLVPGSRKYPVKAKKGGKWVYDPNLVLAAMRRATTLGDSAVASKAKKILDDHSMLNTDVEKSELSDKIKRLVEKHGVEGVNRPKMTPSHPTKKAVVVAKEGNTVKVIRFGAKGYKHNYSPEGRRKFKQRHAKNIARGRLSAAHWADKFL
ncbi:hypothetical protein K0U83_23205, partial [bacterium]|nr:hypothetical protein [bacterium]